MKNTAIFALILLITVGCATQKADQSAPSQIPSEKRSAPPLAPVEKTKAIFHVINPLGMKLVLFNVEKKLEEVIYMDKTLSQVALKPGFWRVAGFELSGKRFKVMNTSKQFVFQVKKDKSTYVGSYIVQCPKVGADHMGDMKKMSFFNRYPFSSKQRLCELVVGSDFENVNRVWLELEKSQQESLALGF